MSRESNDVDALVAALAEEARREAPEGPEPEPEELLDFLEGRLSPEAERRLERQLVANPAGARALLDLADLRQAEAQARAEERRGTVDLAAHAGWRELEARLAPARSSPSRPPRLTRLFSALAAALLVTAVGLGVWVWRLEGERRRPVANLASLELGVASRAGEGPEVVVVEPGHPLRLVLAPAESCGAYDAAVEGENRGDRRTLAGLKRNELGLLSVLLWVEPGGYSLRLYGCEPRRELQEHRFRVVRPPPGGAGNAG